LARSKAARALPVCALLLGAALLLFARSPATGFVFDEQEAILANPYLRGGHAWLDAFGVDFWGLPVKGTIGSYRPLPNLLWWPLSGTLRFGTPFFLQLCGPLLHAVAVGLFYLLLRRHLGARDRRAEQAACVGAVVFLTLGVVTEAVVTVVGQADVLVAIWTLLGLLALELRGGMRELALLSCGLLGLLSKETMLGSFPVIFTAALVLPRLGGRTARVVVALGVVGASVGSVLLLVAIRRHFFLGESQPAAPALALADPAWAHWLRLFEQPRLPIDPQNNPLAEADPALRAPTALAIFAANLLHMLVPIELVADYSFPRQIPHGWTVGAVLGACFLVLPLAWSGARCLREFRPSRAWTAPDAGGPSALFTLGLAWLPLCYLPVSNLVVLLPTVRAERLLYTPAIGLALLMAAAWSLGSRASLVPVWRRSALVFFVLTHAVQARAHALHYESDVLFWRATARGAPASAKAHLNLGVMLGARHDPEGRVAATRQSVELAPTWPLGHVYLGDALCRAGRASEAIAHYERGLRLAPDQKDLAALALQCLWDAGAFELARPVLERVAAADPRGWLGFLLTEVSAHGRANGGVPTIYRTRGYNETK